MLLIFELGVCPHDCPEIVIVDFLFVGHQEVPPSLFASFALHVVLIDRRSRVEVGEIALQMFVDFVVVFGQP